MAWSEVVVLRPHRSWILVTTSLLFHILKTTHASEKISSNIPNTAVHEFTRHEKVIPVLYTQGVPVDSTLLQGEHLQDVTIVISSDRKNFTLDLKINGDLLSSTYVRRKPRPTGYHIHRPTQQHKAVHCFYHGHIRGLSHSMAAVSTCDGISGFWADDREFYHLEPASQSDQFVHYMYRDSDRKPNNYSCGYHHTHNMSPAQQTRSIMRRVKREVYGPYDSNADSRYVELFLVTDYKLSQANSNQKLEHRSKEITNIVSRLYRPLNIYVALVGLEIWDEADQVTISADPNATLDNFLRYRRERINGQHPNDNAQLLTGERFKDGVVGKAVKGPICTFEHSGGVNMDYSSLVSSVATTVAHEMGHNFGMQHDDDKCECPQDRCIMASISGSTSPSMWSTCSKSALADAFKHGMDYCLRNKPTQLYGSGTCGNGFVEEGEECDCGMPEACDNKCCNATTCRFTPIAVCATGACCDKTTCTFLAEATECRAGKGPCDLAEYCDGKTEFCPADVFVQNGHSCKDEQAFCYDGKCRTHTDQCKLLWGPSGFVSDELCFRKLNIEGKNIGNCGYNWLRSTYARCRPEDVMCGMLQCVHRNEKLIFWKDVYAKSLPATFLEMSSGNHKYVCRGAVLDVGLDMPDPGMVPNGAKCAEGKMCMNQKCVNVSTLPGGGQCSRQCNGRGVCNSKGNCHCDPGFAPPFCGESGYGCSADSGPCRLSLGPKITSELPLDRSTEFIPFLPPDKRGLLAGLLILFLLIIPLLVVFAVAYCKREELKRWWKKNSFFKYRVPSIGKPPPQPSVQTSPSVTPAGSTRENKFRSVSFRTGNPPAISNPVLKSSTNRNSQVMADNTHSMGTFKPPDEPDSAIYNNMPPPRPPPPRPKSFHEDTPAQVEFQGLRTSVNRNISLRETAQPPPPPSQALKPSTNRQRDIMQLQDNQSDSRYKFKNSRLALKPTPSSSGQTEEVSPPSRSPPAPPADDMVSALKARFDSGQSGGGRGRGKADRGGTGGKVRGGASLRGGTGSVAQKGSAGGGRTGRGGKEAVTRSESTGRGAGTSGRGRGKGRGVVRAESDATGTHTPVNRNLSQSRPNPPPKPPVKPPKSTVR